MRTTAPTSRSGAATAALTPRDHQLLDPARRRGNGRELLIPAPQLRRVPMAAFAVGTVTLVLSTAPLRSSGPRIRRSSPASSPSSSRSSSTSDGPAAARCATSGVPSASASAARASGSTTAATEPDTSSRFPRWMRSAWIPSRRESSNGHVYLVAGQLPNPRDPSANGCSWQAANRLGSAQSGVIVTIPRSATHAAASSRSASARSGLSRSSCARRSAISMRGVCRIRAAGTRSPPDRTSR